jgi:hypothetical protein
MSERSELHQYGAFFAAQRRSAHRRYWGRDEVSDVNDWTVRR